MQIVDTARRTADSCDVSVRLIYIDCLSSWDRRLMHNKSCAPPDLLNSFAAFRRHHFTLSKPSPGYHSVIIYTVGQKY